MPGVKIARQRCNDGPEVEGAAGSRGKAPGIRRVFCNMDGLDIQDAWLLGTDL